jgi:hypothetical protein
VRLASAASRYLGDGVGGSVLEIEFERLGRRRSNLGCL